MKKRTILGAVCAVLLSQAAMAQSNGVSYVEDTNQGYLFNSFSDNWFITGEGGASIEFNQNDGKRDLMDRWAPAASLYVGKWFSPIVGIRIGANMLQVKNLSENPDFARPDEPKYDGLYKQKFTNVGPVADCMVNLTNWWCGYRPGRVYNAIIYGGAGGYWSFYKQFEGDVETGVGHYNGWKSTNDRVLTVRAGLINSFNITKHFALALDIRYSAVDTRRRFNAFANNRTSNVLQAYLSATYLFNKADWSGPIVPVCPPAEDCTPLRQQLDDANARISELERQLDACLKRPAAKPVTETVEADAPLATIYFPINVSKLTKQDENVLCAVAEVMKANPQQRYTVTGWADNYTGNDEINTRLRKARAASAARQLENCGVPSDQLNVTINAGNLSDLGEKFVALDRAVTIEKAD